jgi:hypothetical protein
LLRVPEDFGGCGELGPDLHLHAEREIEDLRDELRVRLHVAGCAACREWLACHEARTRSLYESFDDRPSRQRRRSVERILTGVRALSAAHLAPREPEGREFSHAVKPAVGSRRRVLRRAALAAAASLAVAALVLIGSPPVRSPGAPTVARTASPGSAVEAAPEDSRTGRELIPGGIRWLLGTVRESDPVGSLPEGEKIRLVGLRPSGAPEGAPARFVDAVRGSRPGQERCFVLSTGQYSRREAIEIIPKAWYDLDAAAEALGPGSRECRVIIVRDADDAGPVLQVYTLEHAADIDADPSGYTPGWLWPPRSRRATNKDLPIVPATWQP